ncbi:MAG: hypothetical protein IJ193_05280 [Bacilli bacterium]|nr:hypothetical protein [Bacilli bacterium]
MELNIFTKEQQQFIKDNYAEYDRADRLTKKIHKSEDTGDLSKAELMDVLEDYRNRILKEREPFEEYNAIYNRKKAEVCRKHGYGPDDFYDADTITDLGILQKQMRCDAESYEADMVTPKLEQSALDAMFEESSNTKEDKNTLEMQYK